jgi:hypothetical protein
MWKSLSQKRMAESHDGPVYRTGLHDLAPWHSQLHMPWSLPTVTAATRMECVERRAIRFRLFD